MKQIINVDASSLNSSACLKDFKQTIVDGYKEPKMSCDIIYGLAVHAYIDTMFKTGHLGKAAEAAKLAFSEPKFDKAKKMHMSDVNHMLVTCYEYWHSYILKDTKFEVLLRPDGQPATEQTFSLKYYEDEDYIVNLEGTIDKLGKTSGGFFSVGDYKTTSSWDVEEYLKDFEMSGQMRFYSMVCRMMSKIAPESILGKIGATQMGAFIDGIFIKPRAMDNEWHRSDFFRYSSLELDSYEAMVKRKILQLIQALRDGTWTLKEGLLNGCCTRKFGKCKFWVPCKVMNADIEKMLLQRDFKKAPYAPLHFHDKPIIESI